MRHPKLDDLILNQWIYRCWLARQMFTTYWAANPRARRKLTKWLGPSILLRGGAVPNHEPFVLDQPPMYLKVVTTLNRLLSVLTIDSAHPPTRIRLNQIVAAYLAEEEDDVVFLGAYVGNVRVYVRLDERRNLWA